MGQNISERFRFKLQPKVGSVTETQSQVQETNTYTIRRLSEIFDWTMILHMLWYMILKNVTKEVKNYHHCYRRIYYTFGPRIGGDFKYSWTLLYNRSSTDGSCKHIDIEMHKRCVRSTFQRTPKTKSMLLKSGDVVSSEVLCRTLSIGGQTPPLSAHEHIGHNGEEPHLDKIYLWRMTCCGIVSSKLGSISCKKMP